MSQSSPLATVVHVDLASGFSGGERQTLELIKEQKKQGMPIFAVVNPRSPLIEKLRNLAICCVEAKNPFTGHFRLESIASSPLILHAQDGRAVHWCFLHSYLFHRPYIITRRIDIPIKHSPLSRLAYQNARYAVGISSKVTEMLSAIPGVQNVVRIPDSPVTYPINPHFSYQPAQGKFVVVHAAKMIPHKAFHVTIEAARILEKLSPNILFVLLGDGSLRTELEKQAAGLANLRFLGHQTNMGDWLNIAGVVILPSLTEGLGSILLEAMAANVPVIGSRTGGIPDIIENGKTGLLIRPGDASALAEAIVKMQSEEALRTTCQNTAREKIRPLGISRAEKHYRELYQAALSI